MADVGFTHVALPVTDLDASIAFYGQYTRLRVVHRRAQATDPGREVAWLSDATRPFVLVLVGAPAVERPLGPFAHLGIACASRDEIEQLCALAKSAGCLRGLPPGQTRLRRTTTTWAIFIAKSRPIRRMRRRASIIVALAAMVFIISL